MKLLIHGPGMIATHLPASHPLKPTRANDAHDLIANHRNGWMELVRVVAPPMATDRDVARVHDLSYIAMVDRLSLPGASGKVPSGEAMRFGFSAQGDNPPYPEMGLIARNVSGGVIHAIEQVWSGNADFAFVPSGGVNHHAMPGSASGFGIFNDAAVGIAWAREHGLRVMYIDLDVHQGDGVEAMFAGDPQVLTVSIHESTRYLFPGPPGGLANSIGTGSGTGFAVNIPLAPYSDDNTWLWAFEEIVPPLHGAFRPDITVVQCGADAYHADPLAHLLLSENAYVRAAERLRSLTAGRLVAIGGGGYDVEATPRIWASMFATFAGLQVNDDWLRGPIPTPSLDAGASSRVRDDAKGAIDTLKQVVFPVHGL